MFLAEVIGTVVSQAEQIEALRGRTLLVVRPIRPDGVRAATRPRIAIDSIGAGVGDRVLVIDEGNSGRQILGAPGRPLVDAPVKTIVVGFVDSVEVGGEVIFDHAAAPSANSVR